MTPSDHGFEKPTRGAGGEANALQLQAHISEKTCDETTSLHASTSAVPSGKKKRARRRQRGKSAHHLEKSKSMSEAPCVSDKQEQLADQSNLRTGCAKKKRRSQKKSPFVAPSPINNKAEKSKNQAKESVQDGWHGRATQLRQAPLYAALDLGTNNCRLLIATPTRPGHFRVVDAFSRIVRLGEGLGRSGRLNDRAMERAVEALKVCAAKLAQKNIRTQRLIATEACRAAENGETFINRVHEETGLDLEIVDRETEARLAVSGCGTLVENGTKALVLFDIGGGSSEIALIDVSNKRSPRLAEHIAAWTSLPVGVVTLAEQFGGEHVSINDFEKMKDYVRALLNGFSGKEALGDLADGPQFHLLGTSGTVTTLAGIHLDLERYDRRRIDGIWMDDADVTRMTDRLLSWNLAERVANPCIGQDRADLVLAGCAILEAIREVWPSQRLRVADRGLREGILTELMSRDGAWRRRRIRPRPPQNRESEQP